MGYKSLLDHKSVVTLLLEKRQVRLLTQAELYYIIKQKLNERRNT